MWSDPSFVSPCLKGCNIAHTSQPPNLEFILIETFWLSRKLSYPLIVCILNSGCTWPRTLSVVCDLDPFETFESHPLTHCKHWRPWLSGPWPAPFVSFDLTLCPVILTAGAFCPTRLSQSPFDLVGLIPESRVLLIWFDLSGTVRPADFVEQMLLRKEIII